MASDMEIDTNNNNNNNNNNNEDPLFQEDLLVHIFCFLGGGDGNTEDSAFLSLESPINFDSSTRSMQSASLAQFQAANAAVRLVNKQWNTVWTSKLVRPLTVDFCAIPAIKQSHLDWICRNRSMPIGAVRLKRHRDVPRFIKLLQSCDVTQLRILELDIMIEQSMVLTVHERATEERIVELFTALEQCHALEELTFTLYWNTLSLSIMKLLMGFPRLRRLKICLHREFGSNMCHVRDFLWQLQKLKTLQRLDIQSLDSFPNQRENMVIVSNSLLYLDVERASKGFLVACRCPSLKVFRCQGFANGSLPELSQEQFAMLDTSSTDFTGACGNVPFVGLQVPRECQAIVTDWSIPKSYGTYEKHVSRIRTLQSQAIAMAADWDDEIADE